MICRNDTLFLINLVMVLLVPSFIKVSLSTSSMAIGVFISTFVMVLSFLAVNRKFKANVNLSIIFFAITLLLMLGHLALIGSMIHNTFGLKNAISGMSLYIILTGGVALSFIFEVVEDTKICSITKKLGLLFLMIGLITIFYRLSLFGYSNFEKSIFPFSEPSHYITTVGFIFIAISAMTSGINLVFLLTSLLIIAALQPSLIAFFYLALILFVTFFRFSLFKGSTVLLFCICLIFSSFFFGVINTEYFIARVVFDPSSSNSTVLVFLQGWEDSINILYTNPLGLGLQNSIYVESGTFGNRIYEIAGRYINKDGAFLASKLIVEFGYLGLTIVVIYLALFFRSLKFYIILNRSLRQVSSASIANSSNVFYKELVCHAIVLGFFFEMFVRGYGYFSPNVLLLIFSFITLSRQARATRI